MARRTGSKNDLIKCEYCGELYSVTYKHCPFCNEDGTGRWAEAEEEGYDDAPRGGGKRLMSGSSGGGRRGGPSVGGIIGAVVSLALIIAAVCIVISIVHSFTSKGKQPSPTPTPSAPVQSVVPSTEPSAPAQPDPSAPAVSEPPVSSQSPETPAPQVSANTSVDMTQPTDFKLNKSDFSFMAPGETYKIQVSYTPSNARGDITWKSSDPNIASVSWDGTVTAIAPGTVTVTASVAGVGDRECIVRCSFSGSASTATPAPAASSSPSSGSSSLSLNRDDFTLSRAGETWRLVVSGTSSAVTWASSNTNVATVASDGTVTAVGAGNCNVTATVDGVTLKCIVRCSF